MRPLTRFLSTAVAATVAATVVGAAPASAGTSGVGSTTTKTSVLTLTLGQAGSLLNLGLLTDTGLANIDSHNGTPQATNSLVPITLASSALHLNLSTPALGTKSPGGPSDAAGQAITLGSLGVPAAVAAGTIKPAALHSDFSPSAAHSNMAAAEVDHLTVAGGALASIDLLSSSLGADALSAQADGTRGVNIGTIKLLDLGALLKGLGVDLAALPLTTLSALVSQLGLPVTGLTAGSDIATQVGSINNAITGLRQTVVGATTTITTPVDTVTQGLLGQLGVPAGSVPTVGSTVSTVNGLIATLQATLASLLSNALSATDTFPLIQVAATQAGINTKAADTVANSAAGVSVLPLKITVAGVQLPAIDATAVVSTINGVVGQANTALNGLLATLGLPTNLVSLSVLDKAANVGQSGNYTTAAAGLTVLTAKVAAIDPSVITAAIAKLTGPTVGSLLGNTPLNTVLSSSGAMGALGTLLGQVAPLLGGAQLQIASLAGASTYTFAPVPAAIGTAPTPISTQLPHTGGNPELAILGLILAGLALGAIRWSRLSRAQSVQN